MRAVRHYHQIGLLPEPERAGVPLGRVRELLDADPEEFAAAEEIDEDLRAEIRRLESAPGAERVLAILAERGWRGWTRIERIPADRLDTPPEAGE